MSSQVLALKYRPRSFDEVVGQETTVRILKNALAQNRLHHAYLFSGPRGIGKTTLARIFAKALNCEKGPTPSPCLECATCRSVAEGRSLAVIEIDGASNTSVEDVRDLRENVRYVSPGGRYKIYIIDEVHMLSTAAFNALLKTLEEPPPHVIFLFATTEPQKIPATVISRLIRFDLRPITKGTAAAQIKKIAEAESIELEEGALFQIALESQGGLRDALGLLDQVVALSGRKVTLASVEEILGVSTRRFVLALLEAILGQEGARALKILDEAVLAGIEPKRLALDLLQYIRHLLVAGVSQEAALLDLPPEEIQVLSQMAKGIPPHEVDHLFEMLQKGATDLLRSSLPKIVLEVLLVRLCHWGEIQSIGEILDRLGEPVRQNATVAAGTRRRVEDLSDAAIDSKRMPSGAGDKGDPATGGSDVTRARSSADSEAGSDRGEEKSWPGFLKFLQSQRPQLASVANPARLVSLSAQEIVLSFPPHSLSSALLQEEERATVFRDLLKRFFGRELQARYEEEPGVVEAPAIVNDAISIFGPQNITTAGKRSL